jgi:hypothetical protein
VPLRVSPHGLPPDRRMGGAINGGDSRRRVMASTLRGARTVE